MKISHLIQNRNCWPKDGEREKVIGGRVPLNVVYDEMGTVHCYDTTGAVPIRRAMSYAGHEKDRGQLKYRCPARVEGFECGSEHKCNVGKSYGLTVRVDQEIDLCRFPSITRATKPFERRYKGRTAVERVNDRLKVFWGLDDGNVVGSRRFCAHVSAVLLVHMAFATVLANAQRKGEASARYDSRRSRKSSADSAKKRKPARSADLTAQAALSDSARVP